VELYRTSYTGFINDTIIEEMLVTGYIQKVSARSEYLEKFKEYKIAYRTKWNKAKAHSNEVKYKDDIQAFVNDMKPFNKLLKTNKISKNEYLEILNKRKKETVY
jgi:hypothetical protein